jgi:hypothetical protein
LNGAVRLLRALPVLPAVLLAGCGVAGTQFHPGVAAQVGDQTITTRHVDQVTDRFCTALETVNASQDEEQDPGLPATTPLRYYAHQFATVLVENAAAEQLAEDRGVQPSASYRSRVAGVEPELTDLDEAEKDAVREVVGAQAYTIDVLTQIGAESLADEGTSDATAEDQLAAGHDLLLDWMSDHDVEVNPKYGVGLGTEAQVDTDLSYAVGDTAKGGLSEQPDEDYAGSLPEHLVCHA